MTSLVEGAPVALSPRPRADFVETPTVSKLTKRALAYIDARPEGVRVGAIEGVLGVARIRLGIIAKRLLQEGKVRQEGNLYFPLG